MWTGFATHSILLMANQAITLEDITFTMQPLLKHQTITRRVVDEYRISEGYALHSPTQLAKIAAELTSQQALQQLTQWTARALLSGCTGHSWNHSWICCSIQAMSISEETWQACVHCSSVGSVATHHFPLSRTL